MYFVDLHTTENIKEIYKIKKLLNCRVNIKPPNKTQNIPQCMAYEHTKKYCNMIPKCIRCGQPRYSGKECKKPKEEFLKCALYGEQTLCKL